MGRRNEIIGDFLLIYTLWTSNVVHELAGPLCQYYSTTHLEDLKTKRSYLTGASKKKKKLSRKWHELAVFWSMKKLHLFFFLPTLSYFFPLFLNSIKSPSNPKWNWKRDIFEALFCFPKFPSTRLSNTYYRLSCLIFTATTKVSTLGSNLK